MITKEEREKFEKIKRAVGLIMAKDKKAQDSKIMRDFEWVIAFTMIVLPPEE